MSQAEKVTALGNKPTKIRARKELPDTIEGKGITDLDPNELFELLLRKREALKQHGIIPLEIRALEQEIKRRAKEA